MALLQMVVYVLTYLMPFPCASALGVKRKREGGGKGGKKEKRKKGKEEKVYSILLWYPFQFSRTKGKWI